MADASNREEWKKIAEAVSRETDHQKLIQLTHELCDAMDRSKGDAMDSSKSAGEQSTAE